MSDRLIGQPMPENTAGGDAGRGGQAGPSDGAPDGLAGNGDSGVAGPSGAGRAGPGTGAAGAGGTGPGEYFDSGGTRPGASADSSGTGPGANGDAGGAGPGETDSGAAGPPGQDDQAKAKTKTRRRRWPVWGELPLLIVIALVIALLIKTFVVQAFFIPSASMENTLEIGDKILVNKVVYHFRSIQPGDIVVFDGTGSWTAAPPASRPSSDPIVRAYDATLRPLFQSIAELFGTAPGQTDFIKRVIGVPGDHVACCNAQGLVTVNGVPLHEQSYIYPGETPGEAPAGYSEQFSITVPPGRLWVEGDNRAVSDDSRLRQSDPGHGTIPENEVIGRAFMIVWPPSRWRILPIPSTFSQPGINRSAAASAAAAALESGTVRVVPAAPLLPLAAGFAGAVPLTWLQRRLRRRRWRRRHG
jgi:signal peptidase I